MQSTRSRLYNIWYALRRKGEFKYTTWMNFEDFFEANKFIYRHGCVAVPGDPEKPLGKGNLYWKSLRYERKLSPHDIAQCRLLALPQRQLAKLFNVSQSTISRSLRKVPNGLTHP